MRSIATLSIIIGLLLTVQHVLAVEPQKRSARPIAFKKVVLTDRYYCDGINYGDFNRDNQLDIVAGPYWYAGPDFEARHEFYRAVPLDPAKSPSDSMFSFVYDFNQDGWPDILVLGRVHLHEAYWYENPQGTGRLWEKHLAFHRVQGESPTLADIDLDGKPEVLCLWENRWGWIAPNWKEPAEPWTFHPVTRHGDWHYFYHGMGVGDVNNDGRPDLILNDGWWEQPPADSQTGWTEHPFRFAAKGGAQMFAYDVDGDGRTDVITSLDAHGWGLAWFQQIQEEGQIGFLQHTIMGDRAEQGKYGAAFTQPHALALEDIDGDGLKDIVIGKRLWAHGPQGDIEPNAAPVLYWFQLTRDNRGEPPRFVPHQIDDRSGVGVQVVAADVNGDRATDILTVSKLGSFVFLNQSTR
jgi:hypothetical protein